MALQSVTFCQHDCLSWQGDLMVDGLVGGLVSWSAVGLVLTYYWICGRDVPTKNTLVLLFVQSCRITNSQQLVSSLL